MQKTAYLHRRAVNKQLNIIIVMIEVCVFLHSKIKFALDASNLGKIFTFIRKTDFMETGMHRYNRHSTFRLERLYFFRNEIGNPFIHFRLQLAYFRYRLFHRAKSPLLIRSSSFLPPTP